MAGTTVNAIFDHLGIAPLNSGVCHSDWVVRPTGGELVSENPVTGEALARVAMASANDYEETLARATDLTVQVHSIDPPHPYILRSIELVAEKVAPALGWVKADDDGERRVA